MLRNQTWLVIWGTLLSGVTAFAQGPAPMNPQAPSPYWNPGVYGYPGYSMSPYGPPAPIWQGNAPPAFPYRYPPPTPPFAPSGPMGPLPTYNTSGPKPGEPYLVPPEASPPMSKPAREALPLPTQRDDRPPMVIMDPAYEAAAYVEAGPPSEPYTLYEGRRYLAEAKNDDTYVWAQANFIHWWIRRDATPPLVTTGSTANPRAGVIGAGDTTILLGDGAIGPKEFSGIQASAGMWLDEERLQSLEIGGFWLGKNSKQYRFASDAGGSPILAQPILAPGETGLVFTFPGRFAGNFIVNSIMDFHGVEMNLARNLFRLNGWSVDYFAGARYLYLNDNLALNQNITVLPGSALPFNNVNQGPGSNFLIYDSFHITNRFYGGQIGARANWTWRRFDVNATMKLGLGATAHTAIIDGTTTLNAPNGATATVSGGSLALASNIGRHGGSDLSVVPELTATVGYQIAPCLRLLAGYNLLYWSRIERVGNQIDRHIDLTQLPTSGATIPGAIGTSPVFFNTRTEFWAQGLNLGVEVKY